MKSLSEGEIWVQKECLESRTVAVIEVVMEGFFCDRPGLPAAVNDATSVSW